MTVAFVPRYGDIVLNKYIKLGIGMFWILYALVEMAANKFRCTGKLKKDTGWKQEVPMKQTVFEMPKYWERKIQKG